MGWDYAISWLTVLPFELIAAAITIEYWRDDLNPSVWIAPFLVILIVIQIFGVRGYGEVEFVLSVIKIMACIGGETRARSRTASTASLVFLSLR